MCQYSAKNGCFSEWHYIHLKNLLQTDAGSLIIESTAVSKIGRITNKDLCLFEHKHYLSHKKMLIFLKKIKNIPIFLQLSHSGRKGSAESPLIKKNTLLGKKERWITWGPSKIKRSENWSLPKKMSIEDIQTTINDFKNSAKLAFKAGYDGIEIHMAHGYLIHQFCSPISNLRSDSYGLKKKNYKFPMQILDSIIKIAPKDKIIGARITGNDHLKNGIKPKDCLRLVKKLKSIGIDYVCISSGGIIPVTKLNNKKVAFRLQLAKFIKKNADIIVRTSGNLNSKRIIKHIIKNQYIDFIAIGREFLKNKRFLKQNNF